jgi:hypothetical protein
MGKDTLTKYFSHTLGAFRTLLEAHLPVRVLTEYDLEDANLQGIQVLVLSDVRVLSDRSSEVIRRFVKTGGGLVATGDIGIYDQNFQRRSDSSIREVLHADYIGTIEMDARKDNRSLWLTMPEHPIVDDPIIKGQEATAWRNPSGPPAERGALDIVSSLTTVRIHDDAQAVVALEPDKKWAATVAALMTSNYGKGRVAYSAIGLDQAMFFYPNSFISQMLVNATKWVAGDAKPPVETDAPLILAVTYRRQPAKHRTIVHLLNDQSSYGRHSIYQKLLAPDHSVTGPWTVRREIIPLHDIKIRCRVSGVTKATQQPENLELHLKQLPGGSVEVLVPKVEMYSLVVFE